MRALIAFVLFLWLSLAQAQQLVAVPPLTGRVVDQVGMLDAAQRAQLETLLQEVETTSGSQIAVLLVSKTEPEAIEQYSIRVAEAWKLGRKGIDDGVLLLVAKDNPKALRRLRIEAGRGTQGSLTDAQSKRILQDVIAPYFSKGKFYDGLVAGVSAIATTVNKEALPAPQQQAVELPGADDGGSWLSYFVPLIIFFVLASFLRPGRRSALSRNSWGSGGMDMATGMVIGNILSNMSRGGGGGFGSGGGGGGFGGGGFSGGGGTFDGGGASGDW